MGAQPEPLQEAFADLVSNMATDLAKQTLEPAVAGMHESWRSEAAQLRRDTAEWISRVNASRQHMDQVVERQHELAQEVYATHARLVQDMAAFQKERRDSLLWQEQVNTQLARLSELQRELSVESTRVSGVVRDIISELARYQNAIDKRLEISETKTAEMLATTSQELQAAQQVAQAATEAALEALSKANEETRTALGRDITAIRRELQEVAARLGRDIDDGHSGIIQKAAQQYADLSTSISSGHSRLLGFLLVGEIVIIAGLGYVVSRMF